MQDAWRAYLQLALGLSEASRKRAEQVARDLIGKGGATASQLQGMAEELVSTSRANREALATLVRYELDRALVAVGLASADEVGELTERVRRLEHDLREATARAAAAEEAAARSAVAVPPTDAVPAPAAAQAAGKPPAKRAPATKSAAGDAVTTSAETPAERRAAAKAPGAPARSAATRKTTPRKTTAMKTTAKEAGGTARTGRERG
jgi:polyhydroxyalkanoate synthesis regulator phasin